jgi:NADH-quinone oxidoreductase subunit J
MIISIVTYVLAIVAAISATAILIVKEVFHAALLLIISLLCVAGIFVTFNAEFLAVVQIVVYVGGVLLLMIFGIMLTRRYDAHVLTSLRPHIPASIGLALFAMFVYALDGLQANEYPQQLSPETIGFNIITLYAIPFELAGVLLLISLIAAIVAATNLRKN